MNEWGKSIQVAATYIGTVVGAGFASGQEILAFFTSYGGWGTIGILLAACLFVWLGYKMMWIAHAIRSPSYESFNIQLFGPYVGRVINLVVFLTLFGVTTVMLAGAGAVFEEQWNIPYTAGILLTIVIGLIALHKGLDRLMAVNSVVVPMMMLFSCLILFTGERGAPLPVGWPMEWTFLWKSVLYVSFNLAMAQSVLIPIGCRIRNPRVLKRGAVLGGIGLGFMLLASHFAMLPHLTEVRLLDIPMALITNHWHDWFGLLFVAIVYAEIFTTLIANVFGITEQLRELFHLPQTPAHISLFAISFAFCLIGYSQLLMFLYPLFGYLGLATILRIGTIGPMYRSAR